MFGNQSIRAKHSLATVDRHSSALDKGIRVMTYLVCCEEGCIDPVTHTDSRPYYRVGPVRKLRQGN